MEITDSPEAKITAIEIETRRPGQYVIVKGPYASSTPYEMGTGPFANMHAVPLPGVFADGPDPECSIAEGDVDDDEAFSAWNKCVQALMDDDSCGTVILEYIKAAKTYHAHCLE